MKLSIIAFGIVGIAALGYWAALNAMAAIFQAGEKARFTREEPITGTWSASVRPLRMDSSPGFRPAPGVAIAMLSIPRLGLSAIVVEGSGGHELAIGPGHIPGTPFPGTGGNTGLAGHRDTFFRPLRKVRKGDTIGLAARGHEYEYAVVSTEIVEPSDVSVLRENGRDSLTLVTCYPFDFVGPAPQRFIVHADCVTCTAPDRNKQDF